MSSMHRADFGKELADLDAALAVALEGERRGHQGSVSLIAALRAEVRRQRLAGVAGQRRFGVEGIDVRRAAVHEQEDEPLGPGRKVRVLGGERIGRPAPGRCEHARLGEDARQGNGAEAATNAAENLAAGKHGYGVHGRILNRQKETRWRPISTWAYCSQRVRAAGRPSPGGRVQERQAQCQLALCRLAAVHQQERFANAVGVGEVGLLRQP